MKKKHSIWYILFGMLLISISSVSGLTTDQINALNNKAVLKAFMDFNATTNNVTGYSYGVNSNTVHTDTGCVVEGCQVFTGDDFYVRFPNNGEYGVMYNYTSVCWQNASSFADSGVTMARFDTILDGEWRIVLSSTPNIVAQQWGDGSLDSVTAAYTPTGTWNMVSYSFDSTKGNLSIFINGTFINQAAKTVTFALTQEEIYLGESKRSVRLGQAQAYTGGMDECMLFNKTLTLDEVSYIYDENKAGRHLITVSEPDTTPAGLTSCVLGSNTINLTDGFCSGSNCKVPRTNDTTPTVSCYLNETGNMTIINLGANLNYSGIFKGNSNGGNGTGNYLTASLNDSNSTSIGLQTFCIAATDSLGNQNGSCTWSVCVT